MRVAAFGTSFFLTIFVACSAIRSIEPPPKAVAVTDEQSETIEGFVLTVISAADNATRLPGADTFVIHASGKVERLGGTDGFGQISFDERPFLRTEGSAIGVMVCHPVFYCGILRAEDLAKRTQATIALATRVIR